VSQLTQSPTELPRGTFTESLLLITRVAWEWNPAVNRASSVKRANAGVITNVSDQKRWENAYGVKCARLLRLADGSQMRPITLPVYPLDPSSARELVARHPSSPHSMLVNHYAEYLRANDPDLPARVKAVCGSGPWIVRSSGDEDTETNVNAGGYDSLVCVDSSELHDLVAAVVFSGYSSAAQAQHRLVEPEHEPRPIAAFVQPLVQSPTIAEPGESPLLDHVTLTEVAQWLLRLHAWMALPTLDIEWVLRTDAGLVSGTSLTARTGDELTVRLALGFGFGGAQKVGTTDNSIVFMHHTSDGSIPPLWTGDLLRRTVTEHMWVVQVRPAPHYHPRRMVDALTEASRNEWDRRAEALPVEVVVAPNKLTPSDFLSSYTVDDAWASYLRLESEERQRVRHVFVEHGSAEEHGGLMFRQCGATVLRTRLANIPTGMNSTFVDPWTQNCYFSDGDPARMASEIQVVTRELLDIPSGARLLVERDDIAAPARPISESDLPGLARLAELPGVPPPLLEGIVHRSIHPGHGFVRDTQGVASPALAGRAAEKLVDLGADESVLTQMLPKAAVPYARAVLLARRNVPFLPQRLAAASSSALATLRANSDLRVALALITAEESVLSKETVAAVVETAATLPSAAVNVLSAVEELAAAMDTIAIYQPTERDAIISRFLELLPAARGRTVAVCDLVSRSTLPPAQTVDLVATTITDSDLAEAYERLAEVQHRYSSAATLSTASVLASELNTVYDALAAHAHSRLTTVLGLIRCELVEVFDAAAKAVLLTLVDDPHPVRYRTYLDGLSEWLNFAERFDLTTEELKAVAVFRERIARWRAEPPVTDYLIDEYVPWQLVLAHADTVSLTNPHQLHNTIHQWLLARTPRFPIELAPTHLVELLEFSDRFCQGGPKLLRLTRNTFEIEIPLSVHKASLLFRPDAVEIEWAEQPGVDDAEIARLLAFEKIFESFTEWFPEIEFITDRVRLAGTWSLRIRAHRPDREPLGLEGMRDTLIRVRTLFDISYDFAYINNLKIADVNFAERGWRDVFEALFCLRIHTDDTAQYESVETLPLGTFFTGVCLHPQTRADVLTALSSVPEDALMLFSGRRQQLDQETDPAQWAVTHSGLGHLGVAIAARWPKQALEAVAKAPEQTDELAATVLRRRDLWQEIASTTALREPALRHVPHVVLTTENAEQVAQSILDTPKAHRRAKQYLAHRFADILTETVVRKLVADLDVVPIGHTNVQERALTKVLTPGGRAMRVSIRKLVDVTELPSRR
jgi:hypothetical protein